MKALRVVGTVIGAFLLPLISMILCAALILFGAAHLITDKTITTVVSNTMNDEETQFVISDILAEALTVELYGESATPEQEQALKASIADILERPSVQTIVTDLITESISELTSGSFDGELNLTEKIAAAIISNPEVLNEVTQDLTETLMGNDTVRALIADSDISNSLFGELSENEVDAILADSDMQALIGDIMSNQIIGSFTGTTPVTDIAGEISSIMEEKPELFAVVIKAYIPDDAARDALLQDAASYATLVGATPPENALSDTELIRYLLNLYKDDINAALHADLFGTDTDDTDIDYTSYASDADIDHTEPVSSSDANLTFDQETTKMINTLSGVLHFFRSVAFFLLILLVFFGFYFLMALLTWSFRYPLIFEGIAATLTGLLLIAVAALPIVQLLPQNASNDMSAIMTALVSAVWSVLSGRCSLIGIISVAIGIGCFVGYIVWTILRRKKAVEAKKASVPVHAEMI